MVRSYLQPQQDAAVLEEVEELEDNGVIINTDNINDLAGSVISCNNALAQLNANKGITPGDTGVIFSIINLETAVNATEIFEQSYNATLALTLINLNNGTLTGQSGTTNIIVDEASAALALVDFVANNEIVQHVINFNADTPQLSFDSIGAGPFTFPSALPAHILSDTAAPAAASGFSTNAENIMIILKYLELACDSLTIKQDAAGDGTTLSDLCHDVCVQGMSFSSWSGSCDYT
jgi:hypothetical protein